MFADVLAECLNSLNEEEKQIFYKLCMENKHIKKRIEETEKHLTFEEKQKQISKFKEGKK